MSSQYEALVSALKALALPMAENEWNSRPDCESYGIVSLDFEAGAIRGDDRKMDTSYEGSVDLFSHVKDGGGWVPIIAQTLEAYCDGCWSLNSHMYERETGLFHWEWTFEVIG